MTEVFWNIGHTLVLPNIVKGEGCLLYDDQQRKYVDLESGVWCTPLGHCDAQVNQVIKTQVDQIVHTGYCYSSPVVKGASEAVLDITGLNEGQCVFLSSGSEAVEFGLQTMYAVTGKSRLLTLSDSFLGSYGAAKKDHRDEWHFFDWTSCASCSRSTECDPACPHFMGIPFDQIGGFVFEPGSSSGLVRFPPKALIQNIVRQIKEQGGLLQINEITTGIGRTGKWFGFQHYDLEPDIVSMGKGLGNGYPVSAAAMSQSMALAVDECGFYYQQSHQNDPLGASIAQKVISAIHQRGLIERCREVGAYFLGGLLELKEKYQGIHEVRGRGLMMAVEFQADLELDLMDRLWNYCLQEGFIIARRPGLRTFRIDPPLIIGQQTIDAFLETFDRAISRGKSA